MRRHTIRKAAIGLAVFLLFTIGYPLAVDQAWLRYNPYVLPSIVLLALILLFYWLFHSDYALKRLGSVTLRGGIWMPMTFFLFGSVVCGIVGLGYYGLLRVSRTHIAALLAHEDTPGNKLEAGTQAKLPPVDTAI